MHRLERYLARAQWQGLLLVLLGLLSIDAFLALANELDDLRAGAYELPDALVYVLLTLPRRIYEFLPMAAFAGTLVGVGALAARSELVAMRIAGYSRIRIGMACLKSAGLAALLMLFLGETLMPWAEQSARDLKYSLQSVHSGKHLGDVIWLRDGQRYMRVFRVQAGDQSQLLDVLLLQLDAQGRLKSRISAESMQTSKIIWKLKNVRQLMFTSGEVSSAHKDELEIQPMGDRRLLQAGIINPRFLAMRDLSAIMNSMRKRGMDEKAYQVAWWVHVVNPFTVLVLALAASSFLYGSQRGGTAGRRLLLGVVLGLTFYLVNRTLGNLAQVYGWAVPLLVSLPTTLVLLGSLWKLRQEAD